MRALREGERVDSEEISFESKGVALHGTIWRPTQAGDGTGTVLIGGSGQTDRTNGGYFDALRDRLVSAGIAVLGYDKRGAGRSGGSWPSASVDDLAADAAAAVEALRGNEGVDRHRIGLFGHSEGGWVALRARRNACPRFIVLNSCPALSFLDSEVYALTTAGVDSNRAQGLFERLRQAAREGADTAAANRLLAHTGDPFLDTVLEQASFRLDTDRWEQLRSWIEYSPSADLASLNVATLAIYGELDPLTPVEASLRFLGQKTAIVDTVVIPGADHRLQVDGQLAGSYLDTVTGWVTSSSSTAA
nr:alpha/beta hydrolase [Actinopolymorpha rutila]